MIARQAALDRGASGLLGWVGRPRAMIVLNGEEYLTVKEAARLLGVKPATLYAYVSRGVLRSYRQGIKRRRLYRRAEIETLLRVAPSAEAPRAFATRAPAPLRSTPGTAMSRAPAHRAMTPDIPLAESWIRD